MSIVMTQADWLALFAHFASLSLLAIGGAISTAPDMHRFLVTQQHWLSDAQFNSSIALAQAAPGPNVLFIALLGWNVGLNAGTGLGGATELGLALLGVLLTMAGTLLPSTVVSYAAARWAHHNHELRAVRAFKVGMAPIVIALLLATSWLMTAAHNQPSRDWPLWALTAVATLVIWRTRLHLLWLLAAGALLGALGLV